MKIIIKITAVLAVIIGLLSVIVGTSVLLGFFDPGYQYFELLIIYNIIVGVVSTADGILIWQKSKKVLLLSYIITGFHVLVLLLLLIMYREIISTNSINAMVFRSGLWIIFSLIMRKANYKVKTDNS